MYLAIEVVVLCLVFWALCALGTGGDKKNIKSFWSYPTEVQKIASDREELLPLIPKARPYYVSFISNVITFSVVLFIFAVWIRVTGNFLANFVIVLILGEGLNLFDFVVIDILWWRHAKRVRFSGTEDKPELYKPIDVHFYPFLRGVACFLIVALIVGGIITAF